MLLLHFCNMNELWINILLLAAIVLVAFAAIYSPFDIRFEDGEDIEW
jgi:cell division protein FtsL